MCCLNDHNVCRATAKTNFRYNLPEVRPTPKSTKDQTKVLAYPSYLASIAFCKQWESDLDQIDSHILCLKLEVLLDSNIVTCEASEEKR